MAQFLAAAYTLSPNSDRTGIRLRGPAIQRLNGLAESIISEGVVAGAIQVPGEGRRIGDHQAPAAEPLAPPPGHEGAARSMEVALKSCGVEPAAVSNGDANGDWATIAKNGAWTQEL